MAEIKRFRSGLRASQVVIAGRHLETAGIVAQCPEQDIELQTKCVLGQLENLLQEAGSNKQQILKIQIWLADMADFPGMNQVYDAWISEIEKPARACVGAALADPNYRIEIQATALV